MTADRTLYLGADAGRRGGLSLIDGSDTAVVCSLSKHSETEVADFLRQYAPFIICATIERVWMRSGDSPNVGKLIESYGFLRGLLAAFDIKRAEVIPQTWQKKLGVPGDDKPALRQFMSQRYPGTRWTDSVAAAGCLAHYTYITSTRVPRANSNDSGWDREVADPPVGDGKNGDGEALSPAAKEIREWSERNG